MSVADWFNRIVDPTHATLCVFSKADSLALKIQYNCNRASSDVGVTATLVPTIINAIHSLHEVLVHRKPSCLYRRRVCWLTHSGCYELFAEVLVNKSSAGQLGDKTWHSGHWNCSVKDPINSIHRVTVTKHFREASLVMVISFSFCRTACGSLCKLQQ